MRRSLISNCFSGFNAYISRYPRALESFEIIRGRRLSP